MIDTCAAWQFSQHKKEETWQPKRMAAQGVMRQVESLAARAGRRGLERELIKSDQGTAEFELVRDLWRLSRDEIDVDHFVRAHGYHGPREGLVESIVWREDPAP
jgi:hypothetical protein